MLLGKVGDGCISVSSGSGVSVSSEHCGLKYRGGKCRTSVGISFLHAGNQRMLITSTRAACDAYCPMVEPVASTFGRDEPSRPPSTDLAVRSVGALDPIGDRPGGECGGLW